VDDGSTDGSPMICDQYAIQDSRIRVIHKKNGGLSDARNCGIRTAKGNYLIFLDSDDYWDDKSALEALFRALYDGQETTDMLVFQMKQFYPDGTVLQTSMEYPVLWNSLSSQETLRCMIESGMLPGSACILAVRRLFLEREALYFEVGMRSEDIEWLLRAVNCLPNYQFLNRPFYMYRKDRVGSITYAVEYSYLEQMRTRLIDRYSHATYTNQDVAFYAKSYLAYQFTILMAKACMLKQAQERKQYLNALCSMREVLSYDLHPKVKLVNRVVKFLGFRGTARLLGVYLMLRKR